MSDSNININATTGSGLPLDVLNSLIGKRAALMNQTTQQACIAITIQTLKSIRAATKVGNGKLKKFIETEPTTDLDIQLKERKDLVVGYKTKDHIKKPCVRFKNGHVFGGAIWWRVNQPFDAKQLKVFESTLSDSRSETWNKKQTGYIVAQDKNKAKEWLEWRFRNTVKKSSSLARTAISRAMVLTNDKPAQLENLNRANVLNSNVKVEKNLYNGNFLGTSGEYSISVEDSLKYAIKALKGGEAVINQAMARAANSVSANLRNYVANNPTDKFFEEDFKTPFPKEWFENN